MYTKTFKNVQFKELNHNSSEAYGAVGARLIMSADGMKEQEVYVDTLMGWRIDFQDWRTLVGKTFTFHYSSEEGEKYSENKYDKAYEKDELCYVTVEGIPYYNPWKQAPECHHDRHGEVDSDGYCVCEDCGEVVNFKISK
jgi:hypothetical protein